MVEQLKNKAEEAKKEIKEGAVKAGNFFKGIFNKMPDYLKTRLLSALVLIPIAIFIIYSPSVIFSAFVIASAILMAFEWNTIAKSEEENNMWKILGLIYILLPTVSLTYIKSTENGSDVVLWTFLIVWATDIAGLLVGKTIGGPKLAPTISPNKTWSGLIGGVLASMFVALLTSVIFKESASFFIIFGGILAVVEQIGDLIESKFKRTFGVKDSGNLIPGHGGIMDRLDGLTLVAPVVAIVLLLSKNIF